MTRAHIYPLSRLVHAPARDWERLLSSIEEGKEFAFSYYLPMREAVVKYCASRGQHRGNIVAEMLARARAAGGARGASVARGNLGAFECFQEAFYPRIARFRRDFLRGRRPRCQFEGLALEGAPHLEVIDDNGRKRHIFLHAAEWSRDDLLAYLELLGIVIEQRYGGDPKSLWVQDLRSGEDIGWRPSARLRKRCQDAAKLYTRLTNAMGNP